MFQVGLHSTNYAQTLHHKHTWWSGCLTPFIIKLGIRWKWVVSFTPRPFHL